MSNTDVCRDINMLHPRVRIMTEQMIEKINDEKLPFELYETFRTEERSDYLYQKNPNGAVPGGYSYHNYGLAVDFVGMVDGNWSWDSKLPWDALYDIGKNIGFHSGHEWSPPDSPHFQYSFGFSAKELMAGATPPVYDKYMEWAFRAGIILNDDWDEYATRYEVSVMMNKLVKHLEKEYNI